MQNAWHPDNTDRPTGCRGISGTHSDDQSRSPGFMVVIVVHTREKPIHGADASVSVGRVRHRPNPRPHEVKCDYSVKCEHSVNCWLEVLAQVFTSMFIQSFSFRPTSGIPGLKHLLS